MLDLRRRKWPYGSVLFLVFILLAPPSWAGTFTAFGSKTYIRQTGEPITETDRFIVFNPNTTYTLEIHNGGLEDDEFELVSSSIIFINGSQVVGPNEFNQKVTFINKQVSLNATNEISVEVRGKPGGAITILIIGTDDDPPVITATATPVANSVGWNNQDVTVSFECSDAISGIASCSDPVVVSTEGGGQIITGTATDLAGNTASASVTLNIDKTAPDLVASTDPPPNPAGWNNTDPTVSFAAVDLLSGVGSVSPPVVVTTEGANQSVNGSATDLAGNTSMVNVAINLDKTAPTIELTSPTDGTVVSSSPTTVSGAVDDSTASIEINGFAVEGPNGSYLVDIPLVEGVNTITGTATDPADNTGTDSINVTLDTTPPIVSITSPLEGETVNEGTVLPITVDATDAVGVGAVNFLVDDQVVFTDSTPPYEHDFSVPSGGSNLTLGATAVDLVGNIGVAETVTIGVASARNPRPLYPEQKFPVGRFPEAMVLADINLDGFMDVVTVTDWRDSVSILLGKGDGTFQTERRLPVGSDSFDDDPRGVAVADLNSDGFPDLVTPNSDSNDISVFLGFGDGTFRPEVRFPAGTFPNSIAVSDLNLDGKLDLVTTNSSGVFQRGSISVLVGNGDGTFQAPQGFVGGVFPSSIALIDLNLDGAPDVATANWSSDDISIFLGNGDGTVQPELRISIGDWPYSITAADLNLDGKPDLITPNRVTRDLSILLGNGDGTFQPERRFAVGIGPQFVGVADLNLDGYPDLAAANFNNLGGVSILLGNGDGNFQRERRLDAGSGPTSVGFADLDFDGFAELITANSGSHNVSVLFGKGDGTFENQRVTSLEEGLRPFSVAVADLNLDGFPDAVTANTETDDVSVMLGNGDGTFFPGLRFSTGDSPRSLKIADLNLDGFLDLIMANGGSNSVSVFTGKGDGTFFPRQDFEVGVNPRSVVVADLNFDTLLDVVTANNNHFLGNPNDISVLLGHGDGTFQPEQRFSVTGRPLWVETADLNSDGFFDIILAKDSKGFSVLFGKGDGTFQPEKSISDDLDLTAMAVDDLNQDAVPDIFGLKNFGTLLYVLLGNGDGTFQTQQALSLLGGNNMIVSADLNFDGLIDLVTTNSGSGNTGPSDVSVLLGNGDGTFQPEQRFGTNKNPQYVTVADMNLDGMPDLVTANVTTKDVSVLLHAHGVIQAPLGIEFTEPLNGDSIEATTITVRGAVTDSTAMVTVNGLAAIVTDNHFEVQNVPIYPGENEITAIAEDVQGRKVKDTITVIFPLPLEIEITEPLNGAVVETPTITVRGTVTHPGASVSVSPRGLTPTVNGDQFEIQGVPLVPGTNRIIVFATETTQRTFDVVQITFEPPLTLSIDSPANGEEFSTNAISVAGTVSDSTATVLVNGIEAAVQDGTFWAQGILLIPGQNVITAIAEDGNGRTASDTVTVTYSPSLIDISITFPIEGSILGRSEVTVTGTVVTDAQEVGISVNGVLANVSGTQFVANGVPLIDGSNVITASARDGTGTVAEAQVNVTAVTTDPQITLTSNIASGIPPLDVNLRIISTFPFTESTLSVIGPALPEITPVSEEEYLVTFTTEGLYFFTAEVIDDQGNLHTDTMGITVLNQIELDALLMGKWEEMRDALVNLNINGALENITEGARPKYEQLFNDFGVDLPSVATNMPELQLIRIIGEVAAYYVTKLEDGIEKAHFVYFLRDANGIWKLAAF